METAFLSHKLLLCSECTGNQRSREETQRVLIDWDKLSEVHSLSLLWGYTSLIQLVWMVTLMAMTDPPIWTPQRGLHYLMKLTVLILAPRNLAPACVMKEHWGLAILCLLSALAIQLNASTPKNKSDLAQLIFSPQVSMSEARTPTC